MEKIEVIQILSKIESVYPQFKITDDTLVMWIEVAKGMDYQLVLQRLTAHIAKHRFPPVLAEIAAFQESENGYLQKTKQWAQEGRGRIERDHQQPRRRPKPDWLFKSILR
jgi:Loader and inhibitor of phage G40P